jgi:hypothetical protein
LNFWLSYTQGTVSTPPVACHLLPKVYIIESPEPRLIESAIPEIIALALDEKDNVGGIRKTAIQLLGALFTRPSNATNEHAGAPSLVDSPVVKQITPLATGFMGLLQNENLRPSIIQLLSLMSADVTVRRTISLQIIAVAFGPDNESLRWHCELLARLISDGMSPMYHLWFWTEVVLQVVSTTKLSIRLCFSSRRPW